MKMNELWISVNIRISVNDKYQLLKNINEWWISMNDNYQWMMNIKESWYSINDEL